MNLKRFRVRRAFTLVEVMIVVLIMGVLLSIALPSFVKAKENSTGRSCVHNLRQLESAKTQWVLDNRIPNDPAYTPAMTDLVGPELYIRKEPHCPSNGRYEINDVTALATCNIGGVHVLE
jgi:prepilin-type N-terminal cleavage/methylation domain-containing protein